MTFEQETLWLAGLLEGEGCFCGHDPKQNGFFISLGMTDEDIVRRAAGIMHSKVYPADRKGNRKRLWRTWVSTDRAIVVCHRILPFMGQRRKAKIEELLSRAARRMSKAEIMRCNQRKRWKHRTVTLDLALEQK